MTHDLISELDEFVSFVRSLDNVKDEIWLSPLGEGKWRIHNVISHIMKWDDYFNNVTFPKLLKSKSPELREPPDYLGFNEQSIIYGEGRNKKEIIEETIRNRQIMINNLNMLEDNQFSIIYPGDRGFTIGTYLTEFFISHERYHMKQIQDFLMTKQIM